MFAGGYYITLYAIRLDNTFIQKCLCTAFLRVIKRTRHYYISNYILYTYVCVTKIEKIRFYFI